MHTKRIYLIVWTLLVLIYKRGDCLDRHECLTWEINRNLLTLICRLKHFSEPVILIDNHEHEYIGCFFNEAINACISRPKSHNITVDNSTNTVILTIEDVHKKDVNGKWKCKQGKNIYETEVSISKGIISATNLHISGVLQNTGTDSQVVKLTCYSCREPRKNNIEFLINGSSFDSISYNKNTGHCTHKDGFCKPQDCFCDPAGNEFTRLFYVTNTNVIYFSCYSSFLDNDKKSIFSLNVTILFNGKVFHYIGSETKVLKPPSQNYDQDNRNKSASMNTTHINSSGMDSKRTEIPVILWVVAGVSIIIVLVPPVILSFLCVRNMIITKKDEIQSNDHETTHVLTKDSETLRDDRDFQTSIETVDSGIVMDLNRLEKKSDQTNTFLDDTCSDTSTARAETEPLLQSNTTQCRNEPGNNSTLDNDKITLIDEDNSRDMSGKSSMTADKPLDKTKTTLINKDHPLDKSEQSSLREDKPFHKTEITFMNENNPCDNFGESSMSEEKQLDMTDITLMNENNSSEKFGKSSISEHKPHIKLMNEDSHDKSLMSEEKPLHKTQITLMIKERPSDQSGQSPMSENKQLDKAKITLMNDDSSRDKSWDSSMNEDRPIVKAEIELMNDDNSIDKSRQSSISEDKPMDTQKKYVCDNTKETTMIDDEPCYEATEKTLNECEQCDGSQTTAITKDTNTTLSSQDDQAKLTKFSQYIDVKNKILNDRDEHPKSEETAIIDNEQWKSKNSFNKNEYVINETLLFKNEHHEEAFEATSFVGDVNLDDDNKPLLTEEFNTENIERNHNLTPNKCEPCQLSLHISKIPSYWCSDCEESLCAECKVNHSSMKALQGHIIVEITSATIRVPHQCKNHRNHKYEYICSLHRSLCCTKCVHEGHLGCKNLQLISELSRKFNKSENLDIYKKHLKTLLSSFGLLDAFLRKIINNVKNEKSSIILEIQKVCTSDKKFELCKEQLKKQAEKSIQTRLSTMNEHISYVSKCKTLINDINGSFESIIKAFSADKLYRMVHTSLEYLDETLRKVISETKVITLDVSWKSFRGRPGPEIHEIKRELPKHILSLLPVQDILTEFLQAR